MGRVKHQADHFPHLADDDQAKGKDARSLAKKQRELERVINDNASSFELADAVFADLPPASREFHGRTVQLSKSGVHDVLWLCRRLSDLTYEWVSITAEPWIAATYLNGFAQFPLLGAPAAYMRLGDRVFLRGSYFHGGAPGVPVVLTNLPAGYRPAQVAYYAAPCLNAAQPHRIEVAVNGNVSLHASLGGAIVYNGSLDGINFSSEA